MAIERLRDGLFDAFTIERLTLGQGRMEAALKATLERGHLLLRADYGEGKSHALAYLKSLAQAQGFATSSLQLDPRAFPLYRAQNVHRGLLQSLHLPGEPEGFLGAFRHYIQGLEPKAVDALLPKILPYRYRSILSAIARHPSDLSTLKPMAQEYELRVEDWLQRSWHGESIGYFLRSGLRFREVPRQKGDLLTCRGFTPFMQLFEGIAQLLKMMGFKGWVLLFDELESITLLSRNLRSRGYAALWEWCVPAKPLLLPIFAATEEIFRRLAEEAPEFPQKALNTLHLNKPSEEEWEGIFEQLISFHGYAYAWSPPQDLRPKLRHALKESGGAQIRLRLRHLIYELDLQQQALVS